MNYSYQQPISLKTLVKICGITREQDARAALAAGADALGFNFYPPSSRFIEPEQAQAIIRNLPPLVTTVAVVVNLTEAEIERLLKTVSVNLLQLHGDESPQLCNAYGFPYIKAIRVHSIEHAVDEADKFPQAKALLLDTLVADQYGGTGESFSWQQLPTAIEKPIILAGGLDPTNVAKAISVVRPYAVDVSSGVEVSGGIKDATKMIDFVSAVRAAEFETEERTQ